MKKRHLILLTVITVMIAEACSRGEHYDFELDKALETCHTQVRRALQQLESDPRYPAEVMPRNIAPDGIAWNCHPLSAQEWCSGFWPGILWLDLSEHHQDTLVRRAAIQATLAMNRIIDTPVRDHDLGFLMFCSAGTGLRVLENEVECENLSSDILEEDRRLIPQFRQMLLRAADSLVTLFNPQVGTILSWPYQVQHYGGHNTIMDNMVNLELLYWAAQHGGSKRLSETATRHAVTTMQNHFRPDGSCYHVAVYDTTDGHFIHGVTHQGLADSSMWARGQAWAIYGFTVAYRETGKRLFLDTACKAAERFINALPADQVPLWDFMAPDDAPRDASAAAVTASALLELSTYSTIGPQLAKRYRRQAVKMLENLTNSYSAATHNTAFLLNCVGNYPAGSEVNYSIIYADYYYLEALTRLKDILELDR